MCLDREDVKLCNCAYCGIELLGESMAVDKAILDRARELDYWQPVVWLRHRGRPYCLACSQILGLVHTKKKEI